MLVIFSASFNRGDPAAGIRSSLSTQRPPGEKPYSLLDAADWADPSLQPIVEAAARSFTELHLSMQ